MNNLPAQQRGMTAIGTMLVIGMVGVFVFVGLKVYPIYYDNFKVGAQLKTMQKEPGLVTKTAAEITEQLMRRLQIDNVSSVEKSDITVTKNGNRVTVSVSYVAQENLVGNMDILVSFDKEVEIGN